MQNNQIPHAVQSIMNTVLEAVEELGLEGKIDFTDHDLLTRAGFSVTGVDVALLEGTVHFSLDYDYPVDLPKVSIDCGKRPKSELDECLFSAFSRKLRRRASVSLGWQRCHREWL